MSTKASATTTNSTLLLQIVVLLRDAHFRTVPLATTLKGLPTEPQPPRIRPPVRRPPVGTLWNFVTGQWVQMALEEVALYDSIVGAAAMIRHSSVRDYENQASPQARQPVSGPTHYQWAWAPSASSPPETQQGRITHHRQ